MPEYEVSWVIEVSGESFEDATQFVNDTYLQPCEQGDWIYEVTNMATGEKRMMSVQDV